MTPPPCLDPPPIVVAATIRVDRDSDQLIFQPSSLAAAHYIRRNGDLDFSCFQRPIIVSFTIGSPGVTFNGDGDETLTFDDHGDRAHKKPLPHHHHQFPVGIQHLSPRHIWFVYRNDTNCGDEGGQSVCKRSTYGLELMTGRGVVHHFDPVISNGGSQY